MRAYACVCVRMGLRAFACVCAVFGCWPHLSSASGVNAWYIRSPVWAPMYNIAILYKIKVRLRKLKCGPRTYVSFV